MRVDINKYVDTLINCVSHNMCEGLFSVLCLGIVLLLAWKRRRAGKYIAGLMLMEYSFLIYCSTVIYRVVLPNPRCYLMPFWSYRAIINGNEQLLAENIMNVMVFVPVGFLFGIAMRGRDVWATLVFGAGLSAGIEILQFLFKKGFTEVDDIMHNTLGCIIGFGLCKSVQLMFMLFSNKTQRQLMV